MDNSDNRIVFCGGRQIAVDGLLTLIEQLEIVPVALIQSSNSEDAHQGLLQEIASSANAEVAIMSQSDLQTGRAAGTLRDVEPDLLVSVHYPHILPLEVLEVAHLGAVNLHPAFLPYNRGWHTPTWAILDGTPAGSTLHLMDEGVDTGPILAQRQTEIRSTDTAHTLYARILEEALEVLVDGVRRALRRDRGIPQPANGTSHRKADLERLGVQDLVGQYGAEAEDVVRRLRALTTNDISEAAFLDIGGRRFRVQVSITEDPEESL